MNSNSIRRAALAILVAAGMVAFSGCGGGGGGGGGSEPAPTGPYAIGGSVSGLAGTVVLQNNDADDLGVTASGPFAFATRVTAYAVTVSAQPEGQTCSVANGDGTATAAVSNVIVTCTTNPVINYTIGGAVSGLVGSVVLRNNGSDDLSLSADGGFEFITPTSAYAVTVLTQPAGQVCSVSHGSGKSGSPVTDVAVNCANVSGSIALLAGNLGGAGSADGNGTAASFNGPQGVATDSAGNVYLADGGNQTIRRITPAGVVTTFAGSAGLAGSSNGLGGAARFSNSQGIAVDGAGNVFVADTGNHTIRKITPAGVVSRLAGFPGLSGSVDGFDEAARFNLPTGLTTDGAGNVFVADRGNHVIRRIAPDGSVTTLAGSAGSSGSGDGDGAAARFNGPHGVVADGAGNLFVSDTGNHTVRKIVIATGTVSTFAGSASEGAFLDGVGPAARFNSPAGLGIDGTGNVYVTDFDSHVVRKITPGADVTTLAGSAGLNGTADASGSAARFYRPFGVAIDALGNAYVADTGNSLVRKVVISTSAVSTLAGSVAIGGNADGAGELARFLSASGVTTDSLGNVYVADRLDHTIRKVTAAGVVTTFAGSPGTSGSDDGTGTAALFSSPVGLAADSLDNIYVADRANHVIRRISPAGVVTTIAGSAGQSGSTDASGSAARFQLPEGVAVDAAGNVYVADTGNHIIRRIDTAGTVSTLAGLAGDASFANGTGSAARFSAPLGITVNSLGDVFVSDTSDTVRSITAAGVVSTFAGAPQSPGSVDGAASTARFNRPVSIATDSADNLYVVDQNNHTVRRITPAGVVATIVGVAGQSGFAAGALPATLRAPVGVTMRGTTMMITMPNGVAIVQGL